MITEIKLIEEPYIYFVCEESLLDTKLSLALAEAIQEEGINKRFGMPLRADTIRRKPHVIEAWAAAVERTGSTDADAVSRDLLSSEVRTVLGAFRFTPKGDADLPPYAVYRWRNGAFEELDR